MSNIKKHILYTTLYNVGFMFCSGAIIQTFLLQAGFTAQEVYAFNSLIQIAQVIMMIAMTFLSGRIKNVKLVTALSYLSLSVLTLTFLLGAINPDLFGKAYVIAVFVIAGISYMGVGLYTILSYCLPYYIIDMKEYGKMTGLGVLLSGASSLALSFVYTFAVSKFDYMKSMICFFILSLICFILTTFICLSLKEIEKNGEKSETKKEDLIAVFKNKDTYILLFPNFARGLATGIMGVITVIAFSNEIVTEQTSSYINIVMQIAMFAGNALYIALYKKIPPKALLLVSTIGVFAFLPFCIHGGLIWFLTAFFIAYLFRMIVDTAIPVVITEIIPQHQIGAYTSIRMLVFTGAQAVATIIITPLISVIGYTGLLAFAGTMQLVCGVGYWWVARINSSSKI
jgi:Na+/melibiose symporter-like transporter